MSYLEQQAEAARKRVEARRQAAELREKQITAARQLQRVIRGFVARNRFHKLIDLAKFQREVVASVKEGFSDFHGIKHVGLFNSVNKVLTWPGPLEIAPEQVRMLSRLARTEDHKEREAMVPRSGLQLKVSGRMCRFHLLHFAPEEGHHLFRIFDPCAVRLGSNEYYSIAIQSTKEYVILAFLDRSSCSIGVASTILARICHRLKETGH